LALEETGAGQITRRPTGQDAFDPGNLHSGMHPVADKFGKTPCKPVEAMF